MIKELSEFGKPICEQKYGEWNHVALKEEPVSIDLVIDDNGNFCKFVLFEKKMTITEALNSKKGKARLLLDKAEEVLCYGANSTNKHQLFMNKLKQYSELADLKPVLTFYGENKNNGIEKAIQEFTKQIPDEKNRKGNLAFIIQGKGNRIHEESNVRHRIIKEYEQTYNKTDKACSICGKADYPVEDIPHGMIKKVPDGQSSGSALVSYNEDAFESYGLKGNNNSAICANCAKTYVEGLNYLLSEGNERVDQSRKGKEKKTFRYTNRKNFGSDTAMVFWTRKNKKLDEIDCLEAPNPADVARLIDSVSSGTERDNRYLEPDQFYSCTLSGAAARIAVRDWIETSLIDFRKSIAEWFKDIAIDEYDGNLKKTQTHYARLYELARCCQKKNTSDGKYDKNDTSLARVASHLWNAALKNTLPPLWILTKVLERSRLDGVTTERAALIKLILNRHNKRGGDFVITEKIVQGNRPVAYVCGQIFAKLESIQYAALGNVNAGIRERYFTYAMTSPASAFGRLCNLNSKHFTKLKNDKPGLAITLDKELQELCKDVDIHSFPATFSLEQQGQFAIGYYHQRQLQFSGNKSKEKKED
ncbi:MAG: type I-C CRISPR-associated protein Cas8c/Csd1 [Deltaproteobacteria bacterium]|nr:type I-C CRISPR-associated protein Cas8c/Csd1 [Deltaproteobacteria bacterium]